MDREKLMQFALVLADAAEGCQTMVESLKLTAAALDDAANLLRDAAAGPAENNATT